MTFDAWTTAAVVDELRQTIVPGRVQQVLQVDDESLALEVYAAQQRRYLLISVFPQAPRLHLIDDKPRRGVDTPSPLLQLLRKFVRGAALTHITQPPWERIVVLRCEQPELGTSLLVAELIGRWANLLLLRPTDEVDSDAAPDWLAGHWRIMDCVHRLRPADAATSGARVSLPGQLYAPPPALNGRPPDELTAGQLSQIWEQHDAKTPAWRALVQELAGVSPLLAREVIWRAAGDAQARVGQTSALAVFEALMSLVTQLEEGRWQPCLAVDAAGRPLAFAPYPLWHRSGADAVRLQPMASISAAIESYFAHAGRTFGDPYAAARQQVADRLARAQAKLQRRRAAIAGELRPAAEVEALRAAGEWILAYASQITPRQAELRLPTEAGGDTIALNPALSPADNAAAYFKRYRKARRAGELAAQRLNDVDAELAYLEQLAVDLALAADRNEIDAVAAALVASGYARPPARQPAAAVRISEPRRFTTAEGFTVLVGRNSRQNDQVTFDLARPNDLWLHARGWPGAHVVIRNGGQPVSEASLQQAAGLAAYFSAGRAENWVDVIVTERRRVRRAAGGRPGMVVVSGERVLRVRPQAPGA